MLFFIFIKQADSIFSAGDTFHMPNKPSHDLTAIEIDPKTKANRCVIWLHGLGADGSDFVPIVPELHLPESLGVRFIFPNAPVIPVTLNNGYEMRAWFDIYSLSSAQTQIDEEGLYISMRSVEKIIEKEEERGIPSENIILTGYSQGSIIALMTGLHYARPLAGIIALSGFLPFTSEMKAKTSPANHDIPIFIAHGTEDMVVPYAFGQSTATALKNAGYNVSWHSYPMAHAVCPQEVTDMRAWMLKAWEEK